MRQPDLVAFVEAFPIGHRLNLRLYGRSMWPLLRSGDGLRVARVEPESIRVGDIVLLKSARGDLVAHLAVSKDPVRSVSFLGQPDPPGASVLGKVVEVRRGRIRVPLTAPARWCVWGLHRAAAELAGSSWARSGVRAVRNFAASGATRRARAAILGGLEVRRLHPADVDEVFRFAGMHLPIAPDFLMQQLARRWPTTGAGAGAFDRFGRMVGFAFLDEYSQEHVPLEGFWVRLLFVAPIARRLGVAERLLRVLEGAAHEQRIPRIYADIRASNAASFRLFERGGYRRDRTDLTERVNAFWRSAGHPDEWVVVEKVVAS